MTVGLLFRLEATWGSEDDLAALRAHEDLLAATPAVEGFDVVAAKVAAQAVSP